MGSEACVSPRWQGGSLDPDGSIARHSWLWLQGETKGPIGRPTNIPLLSNEGHCGVVLGPQVKQSRVLISIKST